MILDDDNLKRAAADLDRMLGAPAACHPLVEAEKALDEGRPQVAVRLASEHALFGPAAERAESLVIYADGLAALGRDAEATDGYRAALLADPAAFGALGGLAALRAREGEITDAIDLAEQALRVACAAELGLDYRARPLAALLDDLGARTRALGVFAEAGVGPESLVVSWLEHRTRA